MLNYIFPIFFGIIAGTLYGCSFMLQQRSILFYPRSAVAKIRTGIFFIMRLTILGTTGFYLLRSEPIPSILGFGAFFVLFWLVVINLKARLHGKIRSR